MNVSQVKSADKKLLHTHIAPSFSKDLYMLASESMELIIKTKRKCHFALRPALGRSNKSVSVCQTLALWSQVLKI